MNWIILIIAGLFEVGFTACLNQVKHAPSSQAPWWWTGFAVCLTLSMSLLYLATRELPIGTAYAVWTGIGALGTVLMGIVFFNEPLEAKRMFFLLMLICSIAGLKYVTNG